MIVTMQDYTITDRAPVLIGYEGENLSRNFTVKTFDDLSAIASIELLIGDVNCGAMTVNNTDDTEITISLDAFMIGRAGYKKAQLIMLDDSGAVIMKSNQFDVLVGASNNPRYYASGEKVKTLTVNIDGRTRQIILPAGFAVSVNGDVAVDHIAFKAPASYGDFDFSAAACRVDWTGVDGTSHTNICTEKDADGNWIWALPTALTRGGEGEISFSVSYIVTDATTGAVTADWNTGLVKFYHLESAKSDDAEEDVEEETTYDRLASAIAAVRAAQASVDDVNAILAGITSATPTVVDTVADLNSLDTSKVKFAIVAADGYLYYYDGTTWKSGFAYGGLQEVIAARTDSDGVTHADLKTRLNTAEAQIKEDLKGKAPAIYNTSDDAEVVTFADGADDMPMKSVVLKLVPHQEGSGDPSPDNVRPISGYTAVNVTRLGKNLIEPPDRVVTQTIQRKTFVKNPDGSIVVTNTQKTGTTGSTNILYNVGVLYLPKGVPLSASGWIEGKVQVRICYALADNVTHEWVDATAQNVTIPEDAVTSWARVSVFGTIEPFEAVTVYPMIRLASISDSTYEPYQETTYPITIPSSAGTVYGGELDVANGELRVTWALVDLGTLTWTYNASNSQFYSNVVNNALSTSAEVDAPVFCTKYPYDRRPYGSYSAEHTRGLIDRMVYVVTTATTDTDVFKNSVNGTYLAYTVATPTEITLDPVTIKTLLGSNTIWMDADGTIQCDYPADTKKYIDALTAPDDDMVADSNIASGKYFTVNNRLYLSTTAIAQGEAIVVGTNCNQTDLATALNIIKEE